MKLKCVQSDLTTEFDVGGSYRAEDTPLKSGALKVYDNYGEFFVGYLSQSGNINTYGFDTTFEVIK